MNILSLFDGMACGMLAMLRAGMKIDSYYAYEVDKYAVQTATHNFSEIVECGDVFQADFTKYHDIDFIVGGSPCTYWSIAQKNGRETTASGIGWELFSQYVKALRTVKPKYFIYENNKSMSNAIRESISETFGFEPICINSALVSAQNRQRLYWVGRRNEGGYYDKVNVQQPKDRGILLRDILDGVGDSTPVNTTENGKSQTIKAQSQMTSIANIVKYKSTYGASGVAEPVCVAQRGAGAKTGLYAIPVEFENGIPTKAISNSDGKTYTVYRVTNGIIQIKDKEYPIKLQDGFYIIRKLSVSECKRLQTVPEWYEFPVSNAQAYKMLGNGWTVDVIAHLIKACLEPDTEFVPKQLSFFD